MQERLRRGHPPAGEGLRITIIMIFVIIIIISIIIIIIVISILIIISITVIITKAVVASRQAAADGSQAGLRTDVDQHLYKYVHQ